MNNKIKERIIKKVISSNLNVIKIESLIDVTNINSDLDTHTADLQLTIALSNRIAAVLKINYHAELLSFWFVTLDTDRSLVAVTTNHLRKISPILEFIREQHELVVGGAVMKKKMKIFG